MLDLLTRALYAVGIAVVLVMLAVLLCDWEGDE